MAKKRTGFWGKFDDLMDSLPEHIDNEFRTSHRETTTIGKNNVVVNGSGSSVKQSSSFGTSTSTIVQGGKKVVIKTKNGKTTVSVNGTEYGPKGENK